MSIVITVVVATNGLPVDHHPSTHSQWHKTTAKATPQPRPERRQHKAQYYDKEENFQEKENCSVIRALTQQFMHYHRPIQLATMKRQESTEPRDVGGYMLYVE